MAAVHHCANPQAKALVAAVAPGPGCGRKAQRRSTDCSVLCGPSGLCCVDGYALAGSCVAVCSVVHSGDTSQHPGPGIMLGAGSETL